MKLLSCDYPARRKEWQYSCNNLRHKLSSPCSSSSPLSSIATFSGVFSLFFCTHTSSSIFFFLFFLFSDVIIRALMTIHQRLMSNRTWSKDQSFLSSKLPQLTQFTIVQRSSVILSFVSAVCLNHEDESSYVKVNEDDDREQEAPCQRRMCIKRAFLSVIDQSCPSEEVTLTSFESARLPSLFILSSLTIPT